MIKILNLTHTNAFQFLRPSFKFSTASDPYYILGVQKNSDFQSIKKSFYKLANEYHPDKNNSADASKKFLLVKQAFEQIKIQKGLMKAQNFVDTTSHDSVRPNADQFSPDEQEGYRSTRDYRIFKQKASTDQRYSQFNSSFQTIHDINDVKIKVQEGKMKDAASRFNLESMRAKITVRSQNSMTIVVIGMLGIFLILTLVDEGFMSAQKNIQKTEVISKSEQSKTMRIQNEESIRKKTQAEREKKLKYEQLMAIINKQDEGMEKKQKNKRKGSGINERIAWSKLVEKSKQEFVRSSERVI